MSADPEDPVLLLPRRPWPPKPRSCPKSSLVTPNHHLHLPVAPQALEVKVPCTPSQSSTLHGHSLGTALGVSAPLHPPRNSCLAADTHGGMLGVGGGLCALA